MVLMDPWDFAPLREYSRLQFLRITGIITRFGDLIRFIGGIALRPVPHWGTGGARGG